MSENIPKASASIFIYSREFIIDNYGKETWQKISDGLTEDESKIANSDYIPNEWYPVYLLNRVLNILDRLRSADNKESIIPIVEYITQKDLKPVFNMFINLKDPVFVLQNVPSIWNRYFNTGKVAIELSDPENKYFQFSLTEGTDENIYSGEAICRHGTVTWIKTALEIAGAQNIDIQHSKCRYHGDPACINDVKWD